MLTQRVFSMRPSTLWKDNAHTHISRSYMRCMNIHNYILSSLSARSQHHRCRPSHFNTTPSVMRMCVLSRFHPQCSLAWRWQRPHNIIIKVKYEKVREWVNPRIILVKLGWGLRTRMRMMMMCVQKANAWSIHEDVVVLKSSFFMSACVAAYFTLFSALLIQQWTSSQR